MQEHLEHSTHVGPTLNRNYGTQSQIKHASLMKTKTLWFIENTFAYWLIEKHYSLLKTLQLIENIIVY